MLFEKKRNRSLTAPFSLTGDFLLHGPAFRGTFAAFVGALLAMLVLKLGAARSALLTNRGAELAHLLCVLCVHGHQAGGFLAETRAFQHHADMIRSLRHIRLLQAEHRALMAGLKAAQAGVDTFLIIVQRVSHNTHTNISF